MVSMESLNIGIIGAGRFADQHMMAFAEIPQAQVAAFMRRSKEPLEAMQRKWNVAKGFTDHKELISDPEIDAIDIITPTDSHKRYALDAIAAGKHVLCEKPLALNAADCEEMLQAARDAGVIHATNFNQRARTAAGRMKRYIDDGYIGTPYHTSIWWGMTMQEDARPDVLSWRFRAEQGGGTVYELIHVLDMARFLNGEVERICSLLNTAEGRRAFVDVSKEIAVEVPDSSVFLMQHVNGSYTVAHTSFVTRGIGHREAPRIDIAGSSGRIVSDGLHSLLGNSGPHGHLQELDPGAPHPTPYHQFVEAAIAGDQSMIDTGFEAGLEAARLADAARVSWQEKRWININ